MERDETEKFVKALSQNNNVKANKLLEEIMKKKVAKRIMSVLNND